MVNRKDTPERPGSVPCRACGKAIDLSRRSNGRLPRTDVAYCRDCRATPAALRFKKYGICGPCNQAIGLLGEDPAVVESALRYLNHWR